MSRCRPMAVMIGALLLVGACSSSSSGGSIASSAAGGSSGLPATASASSAPGAPSGGGSGMAPTDACLLLTQAEASTALGISVLPGKPQSTIFQLCLWGPAGANLLEGQRVLVRIVMPQAFRLAKLPVTGVVVTPVSGLGDDAYSVTDPALGTTLYVQKGSATFDVEVGGFSDAQTKTIEMTVAQDVLSKL
jgi:hypothetical protein